MSLNVSLFYALLLSRERQAACQVVFALFGYQILVDREADDAYRLRIAYATEEPHVDEHFPNGDALLLFPDEWDIPLTGWYPIDVPDDDEAEVTHER